MMPTDQALEENVSTIYQQLREQFLLLKETEIDDALNSINLVPAAGEGFLPLGSHLQIKKILEGANQKMTLDVKGGGVVGTDSRRSPGRPVTPDREYSVGNLNQEETISTQINTWRETRFAAHIETHPILEALAIFLELRALCISLCGSIIKLNKLQSDLAEGAVDADDAESRVDAFTRGKCPRSEIQGLLDKYRGQAFYSPFSKAYGDLLAVEDQLSKAYQDVLASVASQPATSTPVSIAPAAGGQTAGCFSRLWARLCCQREEEVQPVHIQNPAHGVVGYGATGYTR